MPRFALSIAARSVVAKLGMSLGDLMELRKGLTELNKAARRADIQPAPAPARDSI